MKKVLATVAALGLAVGFTANAFALDVPGKAAETEKEAVQRMPEPTAPGVALWSVTGSWVLAGAYISQGKGLPGQVAIQDESDSNDDFYIYSFKLLPTLQVNDKISLKGEFRFIDRDVFGMTNSGASDRVIDTYTLWMEWNSPYGKTQFGRMPAGTWGSAFLNSTRQGDRLRIYPNMLPENWGMLIFTEKLTEEDVAGGNDISDQDRDAYYIDLSYTADFGKTIGAFWIVDNNQSSVEPDPFVSSNFWLYGNYGFGDISLEYELDWGFGDASGDRDASTLGLYADLGYKMQDWKFGGLFFLASGDDDTSDSDAEGRLGSGGVGNDFNPFQIMTGDYMGVLNADKGQVHPAIRINDGTKDPGVWAIQGYASFAMSPAMSLSGYLGYAAALEEPNGWDDDYGMEAGIGMSYKLMDNLTYGAHFSYLWTGDYFTEGGDVDTQDVYVLSHALSMSF